MKLMNIKAVAILALLSVTGYSFGYQFTFSNKTNNSLIVRVKTAGLGNVEKYALINPNQQEVVNFENILCLESLSWAQYDPEEKFQGSNPKFSTFKGKNLMEVVAMGGYSDQDAYKNVFAPLAADYALNPLQIRMVDGPLYEQTTKAAPTTDLAKIAQAAATLANISICKNRSFVIIDTGKEVMIGKMKAGYNELVAITIKGE